MDVLTEFLARESARDFSWRDGHCLMLVADWVACNGPCDPAGPWRGRVNTEEEARAALVAAGGILPFMAAALSPLIRRETPSPIARGDVGLIVVTTPSGRGEAGGVWTGRRWAVRGSRGLWFGRAQALAVWQVEGV